MNQERVRAGDVLTGTVTEVGDSGVSVRLDEVGEELDGFVGALDLSWRDFGPASVRVGERVSAEVLRVNPAKRRVWLSLAATENPELWAFLKGLRPGQRLSGTVASLETFGVFVALDDGPAHPVFPGVGFLTMPELSWRWFQDPAEIVAVGQRITCEFLVFDTSNGEARLSLRATQPDPFREFARDFAVGQVVRGPVTKVLPFGVFVRVAEGIEGLVREPDQEFPVGAEVTVAIREIDPDRRRVTLVLYKDHLYIGRRDRTDA
ncbi:small subunit ribosomal protein S1 [Actinoplanes octamycinicus]|uniref:Small subunit ribosomal protein S1 n=1 Tax=Actinoplanes octamycinicus TaxID=135948 RepID=A0A7W7H0G0_9ACTN|nr:S1 RNA-binding domain-containing protein [Actinoplanes octamycinicus]MBB4741653.1 small subunit ribosomal protein S1 [Actinoplanes octamycinicus]GIE57206.1 hypothetical protein Aoc01nite_26080 [Actinoplanes octamycinicus]